MTARKHNLDYNRGDPLVVASRRSIGLTVGSFVLGAFGGVVLLGFAVGILHPPATPTAKLLAVLFPFACGVAFAIVGGRTPAQKRVPPRTEGTLMMRCLTCGRLTPHTVRRTRPGEYTSECQACTKAFDASDAQATPSFEEDIRN